MTRPRTIAALAFASLVASLVACRDEQPTRTEPAPTPAPTVGEPAAGEQPTTPHARLLQWLDPEAIAVAYTTMPDALDPDAFATVFALPPRVDKLLGDAHDVVEGLEAIRARTSPAATSLFGPATLAFHPQIATRPYVVRQLAVPRAKLDAFLIAAELRKSEAQGYDVYEPANAFPWKVVVLDDTTVAFFSTREIGFGLGPLTAGRDLPASQLETELTKVLQADRELAIAVLASGPLLHFDLGVDIASWQLAARKWQMRGLDVEVALLPVELPDAAAKTLEERTAPLDNQQIQSLVERVAYSVEGNAVVGRLQLTADDVTVLSQ